MTYEAWRREGSPTLYPAVHTPVTQDVLIIGILYAFGAILLPALLILPGIRGVQKVCYLIRILLALFILAATVLCNYGNCWEVGTLYTSVPYRPGTGHVINASIGVHIGLRWVNITLKADPEFQQIPNSSSTERINYNERFQWNGKGWSLGNEGLADNDGEMNLAFLKARDKGLPWAILRVAEYFTLDGENFRWGRQYQQAGFFTQLCLWLAFVTWLLTMLSLYMVKLYGAYMSILTGSFLLGANVLYACVRNPVPLSVPFERGRLDLRWGWCFWTSLTAGLTAVGIGVIVIVLDIFSPNRLNMVLNIDPGVDKECVENSDDEDMEVFNDDDDDEDGMLASDTRCTSVGAAMSPVTPFPQVAAYSPRYTPGKTPGAAPNTTGSHGPSTPVFTPLAPGFPPLAAGHSHSSSKTGSGPLSPISETQPKAPRGKTIIVRQKTSKFLPSMRKGPRSRTPNFDRSTSCPAKVNRSIRIQNTPHADVVAELVKRQSYEDTDAIEMTPL